MAITLPPPKKGQKDTRAHVKWADVLRYGAKKGFTVHHLVILVRHNDTAKEVLPLGMRPLYIRARVLEILGITET